MRLQNGQRGVLLLNSNAVKQIRYEADKLSNDALFTGPALAVIYRINRIFGVSLDASLFRKKVKFTYRETFTDLVTGHITETHHRYDDVIYRGNLSVGVVVGLAKRAL